MGCNNNCDTNILSPDRVPKFINQLPILPRFVGNVCQDSNGNKVKNFQVDQIAFEQQVLPPPFNTSPVFGFGGKACNPQTGEIKYVQSFPGPSFWVSRYLPSVVNWTNKLLGNEMFPVDPTIPWANPLGITTYPPYPLFPPGVYKAQYPIPTVNHLHGAEVSSRFDGYPNSWSTAGGITGPNFETNEYYYPNSQESTMLWYHDHTKGYTSINVYSGLAGAYVIKDEKNPFDRLGNSYLPSGKYEIELLVQDKSFYEDGRLYYPTVGANPPVHPYWPDDFVGDINTVNGKVWPNLNVSQQLYRFKLLNYSLARTFDFQLSNRSLFLQITTDGGYVEYPNCIEMISLAPSERADILVDFSKYPIGTKITLLNVAQDADPSSSGIIMQFTVTERSCNSYKVPNKLNNIANLIPNTQPILVTEVLQTDSSGGPVAFYLNGQASSNPPSEIITVGQTVPWFFINLTEETHPMHLHLIQFQITDRQLIDVNRYYNDWIMLNGPIPLQKPTVNLPVEGYLIGPPIPPDITEVGWKDTIKTPPGMVTRIIARYAPTDAPPNKVYPGVNLFPFDPSEGPGYVYHCHLLLHEDNEMSRPTIILNPNTQI